MLEAFAVIPDGASNPSACFASLEAAIEWGLCRYGSGGFRIRFLTVRPPSAGHGTPLDA